MTRRESMHERYAVTTAPPLDPRICDHIAFALVCRGPKGRELLAALLERVFPTTTTTKEARP